jgi:hypothetical protein
MTPRLAQAIPGKIRRMLTSIKPAGYSVVPPCGWGIILEWAAEATIISLSRRHFLRLIEGNSMSPIRALLAVFLGVALGTYGCYLYFLLQPQTPTEIADHCEQTYERVMIGMTLDEVNDIACPRQYEWSPTLSDPSSYFPRRKRLPSPSGIGCGWSRSVPQVTYRLGDAAGTIRANFSVCFDDNADRVIDKSPLRYGP